MSEFDHERLDVYVAGIDFVALVAKVVEHLPRGRAYLADRLQRAATSIALNIADGAGESSTSEKGPSNCGIGHGHGHGLGHEMRGCLGEYPATRARSAS
jgi:23S rRNA-intervening sequence protein